jgi:hypothetical protein
MTLLCIFAFSSLVTVILAANTYSSINDAAAANFQHRTPLSYISTKVRQADEANSIKVLQKEGIDILVLQDKQNGEINETWIYEYQGNLCEIYVGKGADFSLADGLAIIPSYGLALSLSNNKLQIDCLDQQGQKRSLTLSLRTEQGV